MSDEPVVRLGLTLTEDDLKFVQKIQSETLKTRSDIIRLSIESFLDLVDKKPHLDGIPKRTKSKTVPAVVVLKPDTAHALRSLANRFDTSVSAVIRLALEQGADKELEH